MSKLDTGSADFWDLSKVEGGFRWSADIGTGCRGCLPLCPSFKVLFDRLDVEAVDGDAEKLPERDLKEVVDLCYQCKLCFNHCPYTPPHRWEVDFPRLMLRARAAGARTNGVTLQDKLLGNAELVGRLGSLGAPLSNWVNELGVHRAFMQSVVGIHKKRNMPKSERKTSGRCSRRPAAGRPGGPARAGGGAPAGEPAAHQAPPAAARRVALFHTCSVEYYEPATGRAAVGVLERNRVDVSVPPQRCCGMPYLDGGAVDEAKALIRDNVKSLAAAVREGREIVVPGPTCSYMLKQEYPWLDGSEDAQLVAANTRDLFEYLAKLHAAGELDTNFTAPGGARTYHLPCHLPGPDIRPKSADVLRTIPGASVDVVEKCSAVDGTWGFKKEYYELSLKLAKPLFDAIATAGAPTAATDCPLAALQIEQGPGRKPKYPIEILATAYGLEE